MEHAELRAHLKAFYNFAFWYVQKGGDSSVLGEALNLAGDDAQFSIEPKHVAALKDRGCDGRSLWELSCLIQASLEGHAISRLEWSIARSRAYLDVLLFDQSASEDLSPPNKLPVCVKRDNPAEPLLVIGSTAYSVTPDCAAAFDAMVASYPERVGLSNAELLGAHPERKIAKWPEPVRSIVDTNGKGSRISL